MSVIDTLVVTASDVELWISRPPTGDWLSTVTHGAIASALSVHRQYGADDRRAADARMLAEQHIQNDLDRALLEVLTLWYYRWEVTDEPVQNNPNDLVNRVMYSLLGALNNQQSPTRTSQVIKWVSSLHAVRQALPHEERPGFEVMLGFALASAKADDEGIDEALAELAEPIAALRALYKNPPAEESTMSLNDIKITEVDVRLWDDTRMNQNTVPGTRRPVSFPARTPWSICSSAAENAQAETQGINLSLLLSIRRPTDAEKKRLLLMRNGLETHVSKALWVWVPQALLIFKQWTEQNWLPFEHDSSIVNWIRLLDATYHDPKMRGRVATFIDCAGGIVDLFLTLTKDHPDAVTRRHYSTLWAGIQQEAQKYQTVEALDSLFEDVSRLLEKGPTAPTGGYREVKTIEVDPGTLAAIQWIWYWTEEAEGKTPDEIKAFTLVLDYIKRVTTTDVRETEPVEGLKEAIDFLFDSFSSFVATMPERDQKYVKKKLAQQRKASFSDLILRTEAYRRFAKENEKTEALIKAAAEKAATDALDKVNDKIANSVNKEPAAMSKPSMTLRELIDKLSDSVYGNQRVKEAMATCIRYRYLMGNVRNSKVQLHPTNLLISGGTGSGKTELIKALGKILDIPVISVVATQFSETGYVGGDLDEIIKDLNQVIGARATKGKSRDAGIENLDDLLGRMMRENKRESSASKSDLVAYRRANPVLAIVFIDEIDKLIEGEGQGRDRVSRMGVQRSLLGMISGVPIDRRGILTTADVLWISAGAFSVAPMTGLLPELLGRFNIRVATDPVTADNMEQVLNNPRMSPAHSWVEVLKQDGVTVKLEKSGLRALADLADARNQKYGNLGMRQLPTIATEIFQPLMLNPPTEKVVFNAEYVQLHHPV